MKVTINLDKAKEIKKETLRRERKVELEKLDVEFMQALERGQSNKQAELAQKKQKLRDVTTHTKLVNCASVEELKVLTLAELTEE